MSDDGDYIAKCNHCKPKVLKTFHSEPESMEWGRQHELNSRVFDSVAHIVTYGKKQPKVKIV